MSRSQLDSAKKQVEREYYDIVASNYRDTMAYVNATLTVYYVYTLTDGDDYAVTWLKTKTKKLDDISTTLREAGYGIYDIYGHIANVLFLFGKHATNVDLSIHALNTLKYSDFSANEGYCKLLLYLSRSFTELERYQEALSYMKRVETAARNDPDQDKFRYARYLDELAELYQTLGDKHFENENNIQYRNSLICYKKLVAIGQQDKEDPDEIRNSGIILVDIARTYEKLNEFDSARLYITKALVIGERLRQPNDPSSFEVYVNAMETNGLVEMKASDFKKAGIILEKLTRLQETISGVSKESIIENLLKLSNVYSILLRQSEARQTLSRAIDMMKPLRDSSLYEECLLAIGRSYYMEQKMDDAEKYLKLAKVAIENKTPTNNNRYINVLVILAQTVGYNNRVPEVRAYAEQALTVYQKLVNDNEYVGVEILINLGNLLIGYDEKEPAFHLVEKAFKQFPDIASSNEEYVNIATSYIMLRWTLYGTDEILINQITKAIPHMKQLLITNASTMDEASMLVFKQRLSNFNEILFSIAENSSDQRLLGAAAESNLLFKNLSLTVLSKIKSTRNIYAVENAVGNIQTKLSGTDKAIDFVRYRRWTKTEPGDFKYAAFILTSAGNPIRFVSLFEEATILPYIHSSSGNLKSKEDLYSSANDVKKNNFTPKAIALKKIIWAGMAHYMGGTKTIYFSAEGYLNQINLPALSDADGYLIDQYHFTQLFSITDLLDIRADEVRPIQSFGLVGGIFYGDKTEITAANNARSISPDEVFSELPGSMQEVSSIATSIRLKGKILKPVLRDSSATKQAFLNLVRDQFDALHISSHAFYIKQEPIPSKNVIKLYIPEMPVYQTDPMQNVGLVFSFAHTGIKSENNERFLTSKEISTLDLSQIRLVVLSGCETGRGELNSSEGVFGLQRGFRLAGVRNLLLNLYNVSDAAEETLQFVSQFYGYILDNNTIEKSFESAQHDIRTRFPNSTAWTGWVLLR